MRRPLAASLIALPLLLAGCETLRGDGLPLQPTEAQCAHYRDQVAYWQQQVAARPGDLEAIGWLTLWSYRAGACPDLQPEIEAFTVNPTAGYLLAE